MTILKMLTAVSLLALPATAMAKDYSVGSKAKEFPFYGVKKATFSAKVVDVLCELSGDCADNCGGGKRNLGLLRDDDKKLIMVLKNAQFSFNGPTEDLLPYCNKQVDVDGIMIGEDEVETKARFYMLQLIREQGAEKWNKANRWTKEWAKRNPEAKGKGPWFRRDPRVKKQLAADGHFGLGLDFDKKYLEENE